MTKREYLVTDKQEPPPQSHRNFLFPECLYTLKRLDSGAVFRVTLSKSMGWKPGDIIEMEDLLVETVRH